MRRLLPALLALLLAAGCLSAPGASVDAPAGGEPRAPPVALDARFPVFSRAGGAMTVAAFAWGPEDAATTLLAVHGSAGGAWASFGPLASTAATLAEAQAAAGRRVVAIELPGYGNSTTPTQAYGLEDHALVVDQVADQLRSAGAGRVVGVGHSMGAMTVALAQSLHESFDGLVTLGWSHGDFGEEANACFQQGECPEDIGVACCFHLPTMDPRVLEEVVAGFERMPDLNGWSIAVYALNDPRGQGLDDVTQRVRVPVLAVNGDPDWFFDEADYADEPSHWPNAPMENVVLPETGHFVLHHRNGSDALSRIDAWLLAQGL